MKSSDSLSHGCIDAVCIDSLLTGLSDGPGACSLTTSRCYNVSCMADKRNQNDDGDGYTDHQK
jgi:hypothetical protein